MIIADIRGCCTQIQVPYFTIEIYNIVGHK